jgi:gliding motility-associated-like protein
MRTARQAILFLLILLSIHRVHSQSFYAIDFVENKGQWNGNFNYKSVVGNGAIFIRQQGYTVLKNHPDDYEKVMRHIHGHSDGKIAQPVKTTSLVEDQQGSTSDFQPVKVRQHAYDVKFFGSSSVAQFVSEKPTGEKANYFLGNDPAKWQINVLSFGVVTAKNLYPGVDVKYYSNGDKLKYDLIVQPGANPSAIVLQYEGVDKLSLKEGHLVVTTSVGESKELPPYAYQIINGYKKEVACSYDVKGNQVRFKINQYDPTAALIIDPVLIFSTYTGSRSSNWGFTAAPGPDGSLYAGGIVFGNSYPLSLGAFQTVFGGGIGQGTSISGVDVGLTRFSPDGRSRVFSTYLGGSGDEFPHSIYVDPFGNPVILGRTTSGNFPRRNNNKFGPLGGTDIFVTKLSADGTTMIGGIVIGGGGIDGANIDPAISPGPKSILYNYGDNARSEVILDRNNNVYIAASTTSQDFPTFNASQTNIGGNQDGVVVKLSPDLSTILFSTFLGGSEDDAAFVLALNPLNNDIYVAGATRSGNFPGNKSGTIQPTSQGGIDGFVTVFSNTGARGIGTYLGTTSTDIVYGIQFDTKGFPYVMGISLGSWPVRNATFSNPGSRQFISKLKPDLTDYIYSTVYGTPAVLPNISPVAFLVDRCENVYVSGWGGKLNLCYNGAFDSKTIGTGGMPLAGNPIQNYTDNKDFYFFVLEKDAVRQLYGSFFGQQGGEGDHVDGGTSRFDNKGAIYQAVCANCGGTNICSRDPIRRPMIITPGVVAPTNGALGSGGAGECNLAAFKINFEFDGVKAGAQSIINGVVNDTAGCVPLTVDFTDSIAVGKTYEWYFGDGSPVVSGTDPRQTYTFDQPGDYRVRLISIDGDRCIPRDTSYVTIRVRTDEAILSVIGQKLPPCDGFTYRFINNSTSPANKPFTDTSFIWDFGDNSPLVKTGRDNIDHAFPGVGTYKVRVFLNDTSYCNAYDIKEFTVYISPLVKASFTTPVIGCLPYSAEFKNTSVAGIIFNWNFGDGSTYTGRNPPPHLYATQGDFVVSLTAIDPGTCNVSDTYTFTISTKPKPTAAFSYIPDPPQENVPTQFINRSTGAIRYYWDFGDGDTSRLDNPLHFYQRTDVFTAYLVAYNAFGCTDTAFANVSTLIKPLVDVPNAFTPNGDGKNDKIFVRGFGIDLMNFKIYNRLGQVVFESASPSFGWDGTFKGVPQPMDAYAYTLIVQFGDGTTATKKGDITLIR